MTKFINVSVGLKTIHFKDGSAHFLKRGGSITTGKAVARVDAGIKTVEAKKKTQSES